MKRTLSSGLTFFCKFIYTTLWIGGFGLGTSLMFLLPDGWSNSDSLATLRWLFLPIWIVGSVALYWFFGRLKRVILTDDALLISDYGTEIEISLRDVQSVSGSLFIRPELAWIRFRRPTDFGTKVVFMPKTRFSSGFSKHPIVKELQSILSE